VQSKGYSPRQTWLGNDYRRRFVSRGHESFHGGGYSNFGFWTSSTLVGTHGDALVDRLLDLAPSASGSVLDVACGQGGTTRRLASRFSPSKVTAVNLFHDQLRAARDRAPGCRFAQMDAARLAFVDDCFDVVICVEAAFHFETREEFLRQSWRVLKPGGHLILSDILVTRPSVEIPDENVVSRAEYEGLFEDAGFATPRIVSCRDRTWVPFRRRYFWNLVRILEWGGAVHWWRRSRQMDRGIVDYLLVTAQKPSGRRFRPGPADRSDGSNGPGDSPGCPDVPVAGGDDRIHGVHRPEDRPDPMTKATNVATSARVPTAPCARLSLKRVSAYETHAPRAEAKTVTELKPLRKIPRGIVRSWRNRLTTSWACSPGAFVGFGTVLRACALGLRGSCR